MAKVATNRANLKYAHDLKRRGYATVVHALPVEAQQHIDELLGKGWKGVRISNEINARYGDILPKLGLKPLSKWSIDTYREKYWKKTPALSNLVLAGDEKTKKEIEKIHEDLDFYKDMIKNKKLHDEFLEKSYNFTKNTPMPAETTVRLNERSFAINRDLLHEQLTLGIISKNQAQSDLSISSGGEDKVLPRFAKMSKDELISGIEKCMRAMKGTGEYAPPKKFIGEDLSGLS